MANRYSWRSALAAVVLCSSFLGACSSALQRIGPVGGPGGADFDDDEEYPWASLGPDTRLSVINGRECQRLGLANWLVQYLQFDYLEPDGTVFNGQKRGGDGVLFCNEAAPAFTFEPPNNQLGPDEFLIGIYGRAGEYVDRITFVTNKRAVGGLGGSRGNPYFLSAPPGFKIRKFFGRAGAGVDAIGIIVEEEPALPKTAVPSYKLGASGGWGGSEFEDAPVQALRVKNVIVAHAGCITRLGFDYADAAGNIVQKTAHGAYGVCPGYNIGAGTPQSVALADNEFITGLRGRAGTVIDQLFIVTNQRVIGPFGSPGGSPFWLEAPPGYEVRRLFGRSGAVLDAIGIIADRVAP